MNIEIANRLVKMRKEKGYSQEDLAAELGISRQAVSKWERAEASPDTDNLILLARLYGVSLDELLQTEDSSEEIKEEQTQKENKNYNNENGEIHIKDEDGSEVHIGLNGIHVTDDDGSEVHIGLNGIHINDKSKDKDIHTHVYERRNEKYRTVKEVCYSVITLGTVIAYIMIGCFLNIWHPTWLLFFLIPILSSLVEAIIKGKPTHFAFPVLVCGVYLLLGFLIDGWHPWWCLLLVIPVYYCIFDPIEKAIQRRKSTTRVYVDSDCVSVEEN